MVLVVLVVLVFLGGLRAFVGRPFLVAQPGPVGPGKAVGFVTIITSVSFGSEEFPFWNFYRLVSNKRSALEVLSNVSKNSLSIVIN
jgi:hypothetical protein